MTVLSTHLCPSVHKLFTFSSSSPEPLGQFQPNLALGGDNYVIAKIH